ncbi:GNAT family N-acetyltransferase [uncultured Sphingomonas sp.]|uniref:GNAT family N-acetyltransferase n=1 Tax=uncultured Sphingomonas sp. TaxID=158754 RepID=UPI0025F8B292|nr:GNAT family N-acetyltransferase [uncultured Sphingomonas sp.]
MADFPLSVLDYWYRTFVADRASTCGTLSLAVSARLNPKRPAMILTRQGGSVQAVVRPEIADHLGTGKWAGWLAEDLMRRWEAIGLTLHDADYLFYLPSDARKASDSAAKARRLTKADRTAFEMFYHAASEQDRDDAWVEFDHWAVFGCFDGDKLVTAASITLWDDSPFADLGVLTLPDARGKGFARAVVQAISPYAREQGYEPQYRCQIDNAASVALARSCGFSLFGQWVVTADTP